MMLRILIVAGLAAGCGIAPDDDVAEVEQAAMGSSTVPAPGFVSLTVGSNATVRSGLLVSPRVVITSSRWMPQSSTDPRSIAVNHSDGTTTQTRHGRALNYHTNVALAIIDLDQPFTNVPGPLPVLSAQTPQQFDSQDIVCRAFDQVANATLTHVGARALSSTESQRMLFDSIFDPFHAQVMEDRNSGAACAHFDQNNVEQVVAIVDCAQESTNQCTRDGAGRLIAISSVRRWIDDMIWLSAVRSRAQGVYAIQPISPYYLCWDIQWGGLDDNYLLQQYACHGGANQWFYIDYDGGTTARLVSAQSGKCIDIWGGSTTPGTQMQQFECWKRAPSMEPNQRFTIPSLTPGSWSTWSGTIRPLAGTNLCLGVRGAPTSAPALIETQTCNGGAAQQFGWSTGIVVF